MVTRYFAQYKLDKNDRIFEISKRSFSQKTKFYKKVALMWQLEGSKENIRMRRDNLIKESDWRAVSDRKLEPAWKRYRKALRDITKQEGFPHDVEWPVDPDGNGDDSMHV